MPLAISGVIGSTAARSASSPLTQRSQNSSSWSPSARIVRTSAANSATSVPGTSCRWRSACAATSVRRGSTTISCSPRARASSSRRRPSCTGKPVRSPPCIETKRVRSREEPDVGVFEALAPGAPAPQPRARHPLRRLVDGHRREALVGADRAEPRAGEAEGERRGVALRAHEQRDRLGTVLVEDRAQTRRDLVDRLVGGDRLQAVGPVALRGEEPVGRMVQLTEVTTLGAGEASGRARGRDPRRRGRPARPRRRRATRRAASRCDST